MTNFEESISSEIQETVIAQMTKLGFSHEEIFNANEPSPTYATLTLLQMRQQEILKNSSLDDTKVILYHILTPPNNTDRLFWKLLPFPE